MRWQTHADAPEGSSTKVSPAGVRTRVGRRSGTGASGLLGALNKCISVLASPAFALAACMVRLCKGVGRTRLEAGEVARDLERELLVLERLDDLRPNADAFISCPCVVHACR